MRPLLLLALAAAAVGCSGSSEAAAPAPTPLQRELTGLPARMDALHPDLFHATPRARFRAQARELARRAPDELLRGLRIVPGERATFAFSDGSEIELEPVPAGEVAGTLGGAPAPLPTTHDPVWLRRLDEEHWLTTLDGGRVVYLGYRLTQGDTFELSERLLRLARRPQVPRVIVDVRLNHGGNNTTYGSLLDALTQPAINRRGRLFVLQGRATFSAAGNFVADVDRATRATFVGEPSGGAPNQWGDSQLLTLPRSGLTAHVATRYHEFAPGVSRLATMPDIPIDMTAADFFAGRDPLLERALR